MLLLNIHVIWTNHFILTRLRAKHDLEKVTWGLRAGVRIRVCKTLGEVENLRESLLLCTKQSVSPAFLRLLLPLRNDPCSDQKRAPSQPSTCWRVGRLCKCRPFSQPECPHNCITKNKTWQKCHQSFHEQDGDIYIRRHLAPPLGCDYVGYLLSSGRDWIHFQRHHGLPQTRSGLYSDGRGHSCDK